MVFIPWWYVNNNSNNNNKKKNNKNNYSDDDNYSNVLCLSLVYLYMLVGLSKFLEQIIQIKLNSLSLTYLYMLVGLSKFLEQIIQIKLNRVKNPNWLEANQLAIYKHGRGFELGTTVNKSS